jgi:hypothetical protein
LKNSGDEFYEAKDFMPNKKSMIIIVVLAILLVFGVMIAITWALVTPNNQIQPNPTPLITPIPVSNTSPTPTISNASPTTIIQNGSPTVLPSYDDLYNYWMTTNNTTYRNTSNPTVTPILYGDPALENSVRIYDIKATPTPTPTPIIDPMSKYRITFVHPEDQSLLPDSSMDATITGILAWDAAASNFTSYAYQGDHPVLKLRFVSQAPYTINDPSIVMQIDKQIILGGWYTLRYIAWTEKATITAGKDDGLGHTVSSPGSITLYKDLNDVFDNGDIPKSVNVQGYNVDTQGRYRIQIWIYTADSNGIQAQSCYISKQFQILEMK